MKPNALIKKFAERFSFDENKILDTLKATAFKVKDGVVTDDQMMALLIVADQYGLNPFTKEIYAFPDKQNGIVPVVGVDGWSRIINAHPQFDGMEFRTAEKTVEMEGAKPCPEWMECVMYRKDRQHPIAPREYLDEVYRPAFSGKNRQTGEAFSVAGPWQSHTKRMLRHKATIQSARVAFGFVGIYDQDEAERIIEGHAVRVEDAGGSDTGASVADVGDAVKTQIQRVINRAAPKQAWSACEGYMLEHFKGDELTFALAELERARLSAQLGASQASAQSGDSVPVASAQSDKPSARKESAAAASTGNANGGSSGNPHLADARKALDN